MIFQIKKYFRGKKKDYYQDKLIDKLNNEHQKLFNVVGHIEESIEEESIKDLKKYIDVFIKELELHVLYEDTNLYEHLYSRYCYYEDIKSAITAKHDEIKNIAVAVGEFIKKYEKIDENNLEEFKKDFNNIKHVLVKRVKFEEEYLYDIYLNKNYKISEILSKLRS